jgi:hypothetical protein
MWPDDPVNGTIARLLTSQLTSLSMCFSRASVLFSGRGNIRWRNGVYSLRIAQFSRNTKESEIDQSIVIVISLAALTSSSAFAQSKTRVEVYHELIEAQQSGLNYVTETS